jgi:hypothetical protein
MSILTDNITRDALAILSRYLDKFPIANPVGLTDKRLIIISSDGNRQSVPIHEGFGLLEDSTPGKGVSLPTRHPPLPSACLDVPDAACYMKGR